MSQKRIAFFHQNYPAQFGPVMGFLQQHYNTEIAFIRQNPSQPAASALGEYTPDALRPKIEKRPNQRNLVSKMVLNLGRLGLMP